MKNFLLTCFAISIVLFGFQSNESLAQTANTGVVLTANVQVLQFHLEHRCKTCLKIETLTTETLESYPTVEFRLINVNDAANEKVAEQFEATGTALIIYDGKKGRKMDVTDFAFMNVSDHDQFVGGLKKHLDSFVK